MTTHTAAYPPMRLALVAGMLLVAAAGCDSSGPASPPPFVRQITQSHQFVFPVAEGGSPIYTFVAPDLDVRALMSESDVSFDDATSAYYSRFQIVPRSQGSYEYYGARATITASAPSGEGGTLYLGEVEHFTYPFPVHADVLELLRREGRVRLTVRIELGVPPTPAFDFELRTRLSVEVPQPSATP